MKTEPSRELASFTRWVQNLEWNELIDAMSVEFPLQSPPGTAGTEFSNPELSLLQEMVDEQAPVSTPIHARAIPYANAASENRCSTGKNEHERILVDRHNKPRLFQIVSRSNGKRGKRRQRHLIKRAFLCADGERWSLGSTQAQRDADWTIVMSSRLLYDLSRQCVHLQLKPDAVTSTDVLRCLHYASRGSFMSCLVKKQNAHGSCLAVPWLDPSKEWFSLAKYMTALYEAALWQSYRSGGRLLAKPAVAIADMKTVIAGAIYSSIVEEMKSVRAYRILDSFLWYCIEERPQKLVPNIVNGHFLSHSVLEPRVGRTFLQRIFQSLQLSLQRYMEQQLLAMEGPSHSSTKPQHRRKIDSGGKKVQRLHSTKDQHRDDDHSSSSAETQSATTKARNHEIQYPKNNTSIRERNKSIVMSLGILDGVLDRVFDEVGLGTKSPDKTESPPIVSPEVCDDSTRDMENRRQCSFQEGISSHCQSTKERAGFTDSDDWWRGYEAEHKREHSFLSDFFDQREQSKIEVEPPLLSATTKPRSYETGSKDWFASCLSGASATPLNSDRSALRTPVPFSEDDDDTSLCAPTTPSPTLSPILVSLSDFCEMKKVDCDGDLQLPSTKPNASASALSLPGRSETLRPNLSKSPEARLGSRSPTSKSLGYQSNSSRHSDDHEVKISRKCADALTSYRQSYTQQPVSLTEDHKPVSLKGANSPLRASGRPPVHFNSQTRQAVPATPFSHVHIDFSWKERHNRDTCTQSELTVDDTPDDYQQWAYQPRVNHSLMDAAKDESTTIVSTLSNRDSGESIVREERDAYRDLCLSLGAEVSKLKNMLAVQQCNRIEAYGFGNTFPPWSGQHTLPFHPASMPRSFGNSRANTMAALSDAGLRGDHDSVASEDPLRNRQVSSQATITGSDTSVDPSTSHLRRQIQAVPYQSKIEATSSQGMESRLSRDMMRFLKANCTILQRQHSRRQTATERISRLVKAVWPRAQVKMYGSHATGLSLPTSDIDFVVCLPAVHKKAVAVAPGALEGINAINETSHKQLARTLKAESWIDPRSIKVIERTAVPVIKVSTKESKARTLQLDITFDNPDHHGIAAASFMSQLIAETPLLRPLVVVLKQFLTNRGLLTSYTGGISSYGLFLLVARYLQEQPSSWGDCGALLMGFLDFYGNNFDPRATGISVRHRTYFSRHDRPNGYVPYELQQHTWRQPASVTSVTPPFIRRNSFNNKGTQNISLSMGQSMRSEPRSFSGQNVAPPKLPEPTNHDSMPYSLDPLHIEDPLNENNNVGRNAFRILSVLRAFSDAHRALVASLEWDMKSTGEFSDTMGTMEYPLLKCLLQNEDVVFNDF